MASGARAFVVPLAILALVAGACTNSTSSSSAGGPGDPGVTATSITVGSIADVTGPLSSDFAPVVNGVEAYFSMVDAAGGVDGRKLELAYQRDDQGSSTTDLTVAQQLVQQDHVFAVVGVGTPFFGGATYLAHQGVPTFGYQVSSDWSAGPSLFGAYGSYLDFSTGAMGDAYVAKQLHATSVGVIAYGVPQSANACQAAINGFGAFGVNVGYQDLAFGFGADPTADVLQMKAHHVDLVFTCLDVSGNVAFARAMSQNGLSVHQAWLNGYDRSILAQYASLMNGVTLLVEHVPFEAATVFPGVYPAMQQYLQEMQRYQPDHVYDEVALDGWINAAQFVAGLKAVGKNLTQAKLVAA
ncbi:MAG: ABC transporter substrate-binding protein, partial [Acidimicrobiales bacterium]